MKLKINNKEYEFTQCNTILSRVRGLMFSKKKNLLFTFPIKTRPFIHMFFVFYPITTIYLDEDYNILEHKRLYPFQVYLPKQKFKYMLELPEKIENPNKVFFIDKVEF
tara:strand:+ start:42 stop:365 length:324 start_codon:yes stop_codon:yes gene_type:complete